MSENEPNETVRGVLMGAGFTFLLFLLISIAHSKTDQREELDRQSYVCLQKEETGRCTVGVVKLSTGWKLEEVQP